VKTTLLHSWHHDAGARFAPFAGYDMPIQYEKGALEEHRLTRRSVGLFDIDHMGQFLLSGPGADAGLDGLVSNRILDMAPMQARYALLLNEKGGVIDDLFIYRLSVGTQGDSTWFIVVNASNRETDFAWMRARLPVGVELQDISEETYMIAVQGPKAVELVDALSKGALSATERFTMTEAEMVGATCRIGRTGYTGEDGCEIFAPAERALMLWEALLGKAFALGIEAGPVGLAARDSLRFEAGMPLHGHEISEDINPIEALLSWACDLEKDFVGKELVSRTKIEGPSKKLVTLTVTGGVPREGYPVLDQEGAPVGHCVAGMFCPSADVYGANAFVPPTLAKQGTNLSVSIRNAPKAAVVAKRPLYVPVYRKK